MAEPVKAQGLLLVDVEIPEGYQQVKQGDSILIETQIILVGVNNTSAVTDVLIDYVVKDKDGKVITSLSETKGGVVRIQTVKEMHLPLDIPTDVYSVTVKASYKEISGQSSSSFNIVTSFGEEAFSSSFFTTKNLLILLLLGILSLFFFSAYQFWRMGKIFHK